MSSGPDAPPASRRTFGLRLALWYATLFVSGAIAIVFVTYYLTASSLAQRDHQIIKGKLGDYAAAYVRGGVRVLADTVRSEQQTAPERLFVRVVDRGVESVVLSSPDGWDPSKIEIVSANLADGTLVQVGKSTEARDDLLARFRATLGFVTLMIVVVALTGGWLATQSALSPIRRLTLAVQQVIRTGRTDARVPLAGSGDALDELTSLFNAMLDKIEGLVTAMRGSLDNVSHDLRTPLTRLRGTAELALAGPGAGLEASERYREALAECVEESDRVLVMLNTLMDISEAESGAMQLHRERVALTDVVARAMDLYRDVADAKGVSLDGRLRRRRLRRRRSDATRAGRGEPARQRGEIHAGGRPCGCRRFAPTGTARSCASATPVPVLPPTNCRAFSTGFSEAIPAEPSEASASDSAW